MANQGKGWGLLIGALVVILLAAGAVYWIAWQHFITKDQPVSGVTDSNQASSPQPGNNQLPNSPPLDVPSIVTALVVCSFAIDRTWQGVLSLLTLWPKWRSSFPDPATLPDPAKQSGEAAIAEAWNNRNDAKIKQQLIYVVPAFVAGAFLAALGHIRLLHFLDLPFRGEAFTGNVIDIALTALVMTAGANQTNQLLAMFGAKVSASVGESERKPIELTGSLVLEGPAGSAIAGHGPTAKGAAAQ